MITLPAVRRIDYVEQNSTQAAQIITVSCSEIGLTDKNRILLTALYGISGGREVFSASYLTIATQLSKQKDLEMLDDPSEEDEKKFTLTQRIRRGLERLDKQQKELGITLIKWTRGGTRPDGTTYSSTFEIPFLKIVSDAYLAAHASPEYKDNPGKALEKAARAAAQGLLVNAKPIAPQPPKEKEQAPEKKVNGILTRAFNSILRLVTKTADNAIAVKLPEGMTKEQIRNFLSNLIAQLQALLSLYSDTATDTLLETQGGGPGGQGGECKKYVLHLDEKAALSEHDLGDEEALLDLPEGGSLESAESQILSGGGGITFDRAPVSDSAEERALPGGGDICSDRGEEACQIFLPEPDRGPLDLPEGGAQTPQKNEHSQGGAVSLLIGPPLEDPHEMEHSQEGGISALTGEESSVIQPVDDAIESWEVASIFGQAQAMIYAFEQAGCDRFDLTVRGIDKGDVQEFKPKFPSETLNICLPELLMRSHKEELNVIVRPRLRQDREDGLLVQLDDLDFETAKPLPSFLRIETSPGSYQSWVFVTNVDPSRHEEVRRRLIEATHADKGANGAVRLAGSLNVKDKHFEAYGYYPPVKLEVTLPGFTTTVEELENTGILPPPCVSPLEKVVKGDQTDCQAEQQQRSRGKGHAMIWPSYEIALAGAPMTAEGKRDRSVADFNWARTCWKWKHWSEQEIVEKLLEVSAKARERGYKYAALTVRRAIESLEREKKI